jgi:hypothetical protein
MKIPIYNQIEAIGKEASADLFLPSCNLMDLERLVSDSYWPNCCMGVLKLDWRKNTIKSDELRVDAAG